MGIDNRSSKVVWDGPVRAFHWINVLLVCALFFSGQAFHYRHWFLVPGHEAEMALVTVHAWTGYAFGVNLAVRCLWGFLGTDNARWRSVLPDRRSLKGVGAELRLLLLRQPVGHAFRSPLSRLSATVMFIVMLVLAGSGLVRAGTDLYHWPLGPAVAAFVAKPGVSWSQLTWRNERELADPARRDQLWLTKTVSLLFHKYGAWLLAGLIGLHIAGVTLTEIRQRSGLISTMISGRAPIPPQEDSASDSGGA